MLLLAQIAIVTVIVLVICFIAGKKYGQRKFLVIREEMKALEKAFSQLLEQMELVSGHNLKVLQAKTEELQELLHVADKKCLYANDLMQELESLKREMQARLSALSTQGSLPDFKFKREFQDSVAQMGERMQNLELRINNLESFNQDSVGRLEQLVRQVATAKSSVEAASTQKPSLIYAVPAKDAPPPGLASRDGAVQAIRPDGEVLAGLASRDGAVQASRPDREASPGGIPGPSFSQAPKVTPKSSASLPGKISPLPSRSDPALSPKPVSPKEADTDAPLPEPGSPLYDVLNLHQQGITSPQIARRLKMGKGEVDLILNIYGSRLQIRKVV